jgi:hypothetical protein
MRQLLPQASEPVAIEEIVVGSVEPELLDEGPQGRMLPGVAIPARVEARSHELLLVGEVQPKIGGEGIDSTHHFGREEDQAADFLDEFVDAAVLRLHVLNVHFIGKQRRAWHASLIDTFGAGMSGRV